MDAVIGSTIDGRYRVKREIARGGMGTVFEAQQVFTGRTVALKLLHPEYGRHPGARERMLREARALGSLRHPNVVEVLDAGIDDDGQVFVVTEMLEGRTLEGIMAARATLPLVDVIQIARQLCSALAHLHARGVVHRDVKPGNVFITRDALGREIVKLIDFSIARIPEIAGSSVSARLTLEGDQVGTPEYMAPEQLLAVREIDHRCDIYALGVTLFEALTGRLPFDGDMNGRLAQLAENVRPPALQGLRPDVPMAVAAVIERALARRPDERFPDARTFALALLQASGLKPGRSALLGVAPDPLQTGMVTPVGGFGERDTSLDAVVVAGTPVSASAAASPDGPAQRRKYVRVPYVSPVRLLLGEGNVLDGRAEDISEGGMLVIAPRPLLQGASVQVRFAVPGGGAVVSLPATVRWVRSARAGRVAMGLEFTEVPDAVRSAIALFVTLMSAPAA